MHTLFSDGYVWPTVRVEEAWMGGLDAIAITEHVEAKKHIHKKDIRTNPNRSYEIALAHAERKGLILIKGGEISHRMPPGHFNAIFIKDAVPLDNDNFEQAIKAAIEQGAFIFWNHPGEYNMQADGTIGWHRQHTKLLEKGWLHGIEIVNYYSFYPQVHDWCHNNKLTLLSNSDIHGPISMSFDRLKGEHRPITLVFAKEKNKKAIKEALFARRTAVYNKNILIGEEKYLTDIFNQSIILVNRPDFTERKKSKCLQIHNRSEVDYRLELQEKVEGLKVPQKITIYGNRSVCFEVTRYKEIGHKTISIPYKVKNMMIAKDKELTITVDVELK
jgi:hypothetical protein